MKKSRLLCCFLLIMLFCCGSLAYAYTNVSQGIINGYPHPIINGSSGHMWEGDEEIVQSTCETDGYVVRKCKYCPIRVVFPLNKRGHNEVLVSDIKPNYYRNGKRIYECSRPGCNWNRIEIVPRLGSKTHTHDFNLIFKTSATCTEPGLKHYECKCGETKDEEIPVLGHNFKNGYYLDSTCTENGYSNFWCSRCGEEQGEVVIPAKGHNYIVDGKKEPTCTQAGYVDYICGRCGARGGRKTLSPTGHRFSVVLKKVPATEKASGYIQFKCNKCTETTTTILPKIVVGNKVKPYTTSTSSIDKPRISTGISIVKFDD